MATPIYEFGQIPRLDPTAKPRGRARRVRDAGQAPTVGVIYNPRSHRNKGHDAALAGRADVLLAPEDIVVTVGAMHAGQANNVIPASARLELSVRALDPQVRRSVEHRIRDLVRLQAESFSVRAELEWRPGYAVLVNDAQQTARALAVAQKHFPAEQINPQGPMLTGSEDFAFMLERVPGSYLFIGNGAGLVGPAGRGRRRRPAARARRHRTPAGDGPAPSSGQAFPSARLPGENQPAVRRSGADVPRRYHRHPRVRASGPRFQSAVDCSQTADPVTPAARHPETVPVHQAAGRPGAVRLHCPTARVPAAAAPATPARHNVATGCDSH